MTSFVDTGLNWLSNNLDTVIPAGVSLLDAYNASRATGQAGGQAVAGYNAAAGNLQTGANRSLATLGNVYRTSQAGLKPYANFGLAGLRGYNKLMTTPASITSTPGYKFRFNQGQTALERSAAASGMHLSGNTLQALQEYGQGYAMDEYDRALAREATRINAGMSTNQTLADLGSNYARGVAGVYTGLGEGLSNLSSQIGETNAATTLGQAGAVSGGLKDILTTYQNYRNVANAASGLEGLANAGAGNPAAAASLAANETINGTGSWADLGAGPRTIAKMPSTVGGAAVGAAGTQTFGLPAEMLQGANPAAWTPVGTNTVPALSAPATTTATQATTGGALNTAMTAAPYFAAAFAMPAVLKAITHTQGGAAESAKTPKLYAQLQRDNQSDPSGRTAMATVGRLVNGELWTGENNQWVVDDLMKQGILTMDNPILYSSKSKYNPFSSSSTDLNNRSNNIAYQKSFGLNDSEVKQYNDLRASLESLKRIASNSGDTAMNAQNANAAKSRIPEAEKAIKEFENKYMSPEARLHTALVTRNKILQQNPRADVTQLNKFIKENA